MSFFLILFSQCAVATDSEAVFLKEFQGTWKTSRQSQLWFANNLTPRVAVAPDTVVDVAADGIFTIAGAVEVTTPGTPPGTRLPVTITFTFIEIEKEGILAVYEFVYDTKRLFTGIGFGGKEDVLISPSVVTSVDQVTPVAQGEIFLIK